MSNLPQRLHPPTPAPAPAAWPLRPYGSEPVAFDVPAARTASDYAGILSHHWLALALGCLAGLAAAVALSALEEPQYRARGTVEIQGANESFLYSKEVDPSASQASGDFDAFLHTQIGILQSESVVERAVDRVYPPQSSGVPPPTPAPRWRILLGLDQPGQPRSRQSLVQTALRNLTVRSWGPSRIVEIIYRSGDPGEAARFANAVAEEFVAEMQQRRLRASLHTGQWLNQQLRELETKLESSELRLQAYAKDSNLMFTGDKDSVAEQKLKQLQDELSKAQADRVARQSNYELAVSSPADSLQEVSEDAALREYRLKLTELRRQMAELSSSLTPAHYRVQKLEAEISEVEAALKRDRANIVSRIRGDYQSAQRREALLMQSYDAQSKIVLDQSNKAVRYSMLKREVETNRAVYESLMQRSKEVGVAAALRSSNVLIVDPARPPLRPFKPDLYMNSAIGIAAGAFLALALVLVRERRAPRIVRPGQAPGLLSLPELGAIPSAHRSRVGRIDRAAAMDLSPSGGALRPLIRKSDAGFSPFAESFRATLASLLFAAEAAQGKAVHVITSANPGEGKTTVSSNLAVALAETGKRTIVIDGDMRQPRLHQAFGLENNWGLSDVLQDTRPAAAIPLSELARPAGIAGLFVLTSGSREMTASALYSTRMRDLLDHLRPEFDMILIDAPPILPVADARVFARLTDGVILVIRAGVTTLHSARLAVRRFAEDGVAVVGTVLNGCATRDLKPYGYGYGFRARRK